MKRAIVFLSGLFAIICITFVFVSPDYLSMAVVAFMTVAVALGHVFGIIPILSLGQGFKNGQESIEHAKEINADYIWSAVESVKPFFSQKKLDEVFDTYTDNVQEQREKGVVISNIEDYINEDMVALQSWRGVVLQIAGILTALGILGTFIGLVTGISSIAFTTAEATIESIETLLQGIATAFYTSIVGVILSIIFNIVYRMTWNIVLRELQMFTDKFHMEIQPSAEEQIRAKQYLNTEKMIETLNVIRTNSSLNLKRTAADPAQEQRMMLDVISGLRRGEFTFMLEPVCNLADRGIVKAESKLHWNHPVLGAVQPSVYMPIVEADGFIAKLDQHIWDSVCSAIREWLDGGLRPLPIVLSVRKTDLLALDVYETISDMLSEYNLEPRCIGVAIDASAYIICHDEAMKAETQFLQSGIKVTITNCTGNLVNLGETSADEICLNLNEITEDSDLESVFAQARKARINLTCENISSAKMLADVKRLGCSYGQGVHLYPEMTRTEFEKMMRSDDRNG